MARSVTEDERLALRYSCPYCEEPPGSWCSTRAMETRGWPAQDRVDSPPTGTSPWLHAARTRPIMASWRNGYARGHDSATDRTDQLLRGLPATEVYTGVSVADWLRLKVTR